MGCCLNYRKLAGRMQENHGNGQDYSDNVEQACKTYGPHAAPESFLN